MRAALAKMVDHRYAERAALYRVGARADLVEQHEPGHREVPVHLDAMLATCAENVLRLASIDCSSPMSANIDRKTGSRDPSAAGMRRPACAISASSPAVLSATVLPPVFGPVMSSTVVRR